MIEVTRQMTLQEYVEEALELDDSDDAMELAKAVAAALAKFCVECCWSEAEFKQICQDAYDGAVAVDE